MGRRRDSGNPHGDFGGYRRSGSFRDKQSSHVQVQGRFLKRDDDHAATGFCLLS
jgi:hypothetical protein